MSPSTAGPSTGNGRQQGASTGRVLPNSAEVVEPGSLSLDDILSMDPVTSDTQADPPRSPAPNQAFGSTTRAAAELPDRQSPGDLVRRSSTVYRSTEDMSSISAPTADPQPIQSDASAERVRRYTKIGNPLSTWFFGGWLMTGGDDWYSCIFAVIILLGISGVWLGTTGVWLWVHGREYGLPPGAGVGIVVVFV